MSLAPATLFYDSVRHDPEARILTAAELAELREAHRPHYVELPGRRMAAACSCGVDLFGRDAAVLADAAGAHLSEVIDRAKAWKVAEARANAAIEDALVAGLAASRGR